jgi:hypothetical protein
MKKITSNCSKYFPNANELTISDQRTNRARRLASDSIDHIIPLLQLTKLTIDYSHRPFSKVIDLLYSTPNVHTLVFKRLSLYLGSTIQVLLSETKKSSCHLSSICIFGAVFEEDAKLITLIESEKLLDD